MPGSGAGRAKLTDDGERSPDRGLLLVERLTDTIGAYALAEPEEPPGRRLTPAEAEALLQRTGLLGSYRLLSPED